MSFKRFSAPLGLAAVLVVVTVLAGCVNRVNLAPVEDRGGNDPYATRNSWPSGPVAGSAPGPVVASPSPLVRVSPASGSLENMGAPGTFTVRPGDTVRQIGRETGVAWQDIVRWNNLENPNQIAPGQVLRVVPPSGYVGGVSGGYVAPGTYVAPSYGPSGQVSGSAWPSTPMVSGGVDTGRAPVVTALPPVASATSGGYNNSYGGGDDNIAWIWPSTGPVLAGFDPLKNKGLSIGGRIGDPVIAAADGTVVYAGSGLRGYGNLVIVKHNNTYLTAYAHNQVLLVKEDQTVRKGQKIAEMGNSDTDRVKLHFEVRRNGTPVDPMRYLPMR